MTALEFVNTVADEQERPLLKMDGYDDCIVGIGRRFNDSFVVYDVDKVLERLMSAGMTMEEATEYFEFNQAGAWVGEGTPAFLQFPPKD